MTVHTTLDNKPNIAFVEPWCPASSTTANAGRNEPMFSRRRHFAPAFLRALPGFRGESVLVRA